MQIVPNQLTFSRLDKADAQQLLSLERLCFSHPWDERQFNLAFEQDLFNVFGLKNGESLLAYLSFYHSPDEMEILNFAVSPEVRRCGIGKRLLGLVLQIGRKMGIERVVLEVRCSNVAAKELYASFGFEQVGIRKAYYPDNREDALVLALRFASSRQQAQESSINH